MAPQFTAVFLKNAIFASLRSSSTTTFSLPSRQLRFSASPPASLSVIFSSKPKSNSFSVSCVSSYKSDGEKEAGASNKNENNGKEFLKIVIKVTLGLAVAFTAGMILTGKGKTLRAFYLESYHYLLVTYVQHEKLFSAVDHLNTFSEVAIKLWNVFWRGLVWLGWVKNDGKGSLAKDGGKEREEGKE